MAEKWCDVETLHANNYYIPTKSCKVGVVQGIAKSYCKITMRL